MIYQGVSKYKLLIVATAALTLTACGGTGTQKASTPDPLPNETAQQVLPQPKQILPEPGLTTRQRLNKGIRNLENGNSDIAEVELEAYLKEVPNSSRAAKLLSQIQTDSSDYYPPEFFTVNLRSGQSLSTLAKRYLGSAWEFYALAKYNGIENPSRVNIGSQIKVPLTQLAKSVKAKEEASANAVEVVEEVADATDTVSEELPAPMDTDELIDESVAELGSEALPTAPVVTQQSVLQELLASNAAGDYATSVGLLESLKGFGSLSSESSEVALVALEGQAANTLQSDPITAASLLVESADIKLSKGQELAAFESLKLATETDPSNSQANIQMLATQKSITDKYHREASTAFRQQELQEAIAKWDIVLKVDPNHSNARAYRTQAVELQERLKALQNN